MEGNEKHIRELETSIENEESRLQMLEKKICQKNEHLKQLKEKTALEISLLQQEIDMLLASQRSGKEYIERRQEELTKS